MGFFDILEKGFDGVEDFVIAAGNHFAKQVDRMTDEEIEKKYSKSADEVRANANMMQAKSELLQMKKEKRKIEAEIMQTKREDHNGYKKESRLNKHNECDGDLWE